MINLKQLTHPTSGTGSVIVFDNLATKWSHEATSGIVLPVGSTEQRPATPTTGTLRYNNATHEIEFFNGSWQNVVRELRYSFDAHFDNNQLQSITTTPSTSNWTFTINASTMTITHNLSRIPKRFVIHGQDEVIPTKFRIVVYKGNNPDDLDISYDTTNLNVFVMENLTASNVNTGNNGMCKVDVYF